MKKHYSCNNNAMIIFVTELKRVSYQYIVLVMKRLLKLLYFTQEEHPWHSLQETHVDTLDWIWLFRCLRGSSKHMYVWCIESWCQIWHSTHDSCCLFSTLHVFINRTIITAALKALIETDTVHKLIKLMFLEWIWLYAICCNMCWY